MTNLDGPKTRDRLAWLCFRYGVSGVGVVGEAGDKVALLLPEE